MPASYTTSLKLTLPADGDTNWGTVVNNGITSLIDSSVAGTATVVHDNTANYTLTSSNGAADEARKMFLNITTAPATPLTADRNVVCPTVSKLYFITNSTTGGFSVTLKTSAGAGILVPNGRSVVLYCNATDVVNAVSAPAGGTF